MSHRFSMALSFALLLLAGCGGGGGSAKSSVAPPYSPSLQTSDHAASADSRAVLAYLAALSSDARPGVIAGQSLGHGSQALNPSGLVGYAPLVGELQRQSGELPGLLSLDYEHDQVFSAEQLAAANTVLIAHWAQRGLVTVVWSPASPWLNDESDLVEHPGTWTDTRSTGGNMAGVDLRRLLDPAAPQHATWRRKLDRIAKALQQLQDAGVVVLWRPMQEMNGDWFWWGYRSTPRDAAPYIALWRDMHRYFSEVKGLHNLLWVYAPVAVGSDHPSVRPMQWAYPGADVVDIVAPTAYSDTLSIYGYAELSAFNKVLAMSELGPVSWAGGLYSRTHSFDERQYITRLTESYPQFAYWVSWHNWHNEDGTSEYQAIVSNPYAVELMQNPLTLSLSRLAW